MVSDFEIQAVWGNANFGSHEPRDIIADTLLKHASIYRTGHTATVICKELGLLGKNGDLTKKGRKYLYWSQETRVRKALQSKRVDVEKLPKGKFHDLLWAKLSEEEDHKRLRQKCSFRDMRCVVRDAYDVADYLNTPPQE